MLLTITSTSDPATDLGFLLHKNPAKCQEFALAFGKAYVFYPEATPECCTAALLLDVDPIAMVRGKPGTTTSGPLDQYVNDRPYVASSFLSVAISRVYGSALKGRCTKRPELVAAEIPLTARIAVLPCRRGGDVFLRTLFEPLGYEVESVRHALDSAFPDWGPSPYYTVELRKTTTLRDMLTHLYVLIPVLDDRKHYYVGDDEVRKLLARGDGWLASHPAREQIARRYLKHQPSLARQALARLAEEPPTGNAADPEREEGAEEDLESTVSLNEARLGAVLAVLRGSGAARVVDLGCGEGRLLRDLMRDRQFERVVGMDVSVRALEVAADRLRLDRLPARSRERIELLHGSLLYRDRRLGGFDAAAAVEVVEHLDPARLVAFERVVFEFARPGSVVVTTPNREYNVLWGLGTEERPQPLRHRDHRFEWTRSEFREWAARTAESFGYAVRYLPVGPEHDALGPPTQMAVFTLKSPA